MAAILIVYWVLFVFIAQLVLLALCIRACWNSIKESVGNVTASNFSIQSVIVEILRALG